jgi:hypothetical protein
MSAAVALLTAQNGGPVMSQREVLGDVRPREALRAMTILTSVLLRVTAVPEMTPSAVLQGVGELAAKECAR